MSINEMDIVKELKCELDLKQTQLKNCIIKHQICVAKLNSDLNNLDLQQAVSLAETEVIFIGLEQKKTIERLRQEYKTYEKNVEADAIKNGIEEKRGNLTLVLNRARKQNIVARSASVVTVSEESCNSSNRSSPDHQNSAEPLEPHDITQSEFLKFFCLVTHDVYREMQNKRAERKRRSTANPQFLYGNKGWDFLPSNKRRRNNFLASPISPPQTRQSVKKKQERISPPLLQQMQQPVIPVSEPKVPEGKRSPNKGVLNSFPSIPNLPSGLIIERVSPESSMSNESKFCIICKQPGGMSTCEACSHGFHITCHNRPLTQTPRQCPKCIMKEVRTIGSLSVPTGMTVSYVTSADYSEKLQHKRSLEEKKLNLTAEMTQLQDRHSQLTISLKNQKTHQDQLLMTQQSTEEKINHIRSFIETMQQSSLDKRL